MIMLAKVQTAAVVGLTAVPVTVEVDVSDGGLPAVNLVGLPDTTIREAKERLRAAIKNSRFSWPVTRVTINLAPADVRKEGSAFDLPMALGLLAASGQLDPKRLENVVVLGELALDGSLRPVPGALSVAMSLRGKGRKFLLAQANAAEAALVGDVALWPVEHLLQAVDCLRENRAPARDAAPAMPAAENGAEAVDLLEVKGQRIAKRAIEVAVAGGHNLLLAGPPGSGKTMLAQRIPTLLPEMSLEEALETTQVYSVMGKVPPEAPLLKRRPFRAPHHSVSSAGLIGGGSVPRPGEISLAHHGVLFLDELPEFNREALEALRQPLEEGSVTVARAHGAVTFPARIMLVASMNSCPCGCAGDPTKACLCTPSQIHKYRARISGPLLDRIDLQLEVSAVSFLELAGDLPGDSSAAVRDRVMQARALQRTRFHLEAGLFCNAQMRHRHIKRFCSVLPEGKHLLERAIRLLGLSARAYHRILKVSRTIADLAGSEEIQPEHLAEAIQYRAFDRSAWMNV